MRQWRQARDLSRRLPFLLFAALPVAGCIFTIGDGYARIAGTVRDERGAPYQECRVDLLDAQDRRVLSSQERISADFHLLGHQGVATAFGVGFVISPLPGLYLLRVGCTESDETFTSEPTLLPGYSAQVELGNIQLNRRRRASLPGFSLGGCRLS